MESSKAFLFQAMHFPAPGEHGQNSAQIGPKLANAATQPFAQERSKRRAVDVTHLGRDSINIETAAMQKRLRPLDTKILEISER